MGAAPRKLVLICTYAVVAALALAGAEVASAATHQQTKRQAELNVLRSPRFFWRAGLHGYIRSKTRTFRTNVTVTCSGGRGAAQQAHIFVCILRYRTKSTTVRYTALGKYAFKLKIVPRRR